MELPTRPPFSPSDLELVLAAYAHGLFPMAEATDAPEFHWYDPPARGQLSIENLQIPARLARTVQHFPYRVSINQDFAAVIAGCAAPGAGRAQSWINPGISELFTALHWAGFAHSVECRDQSGTLVGGLYGLALGGAFMGESMFSRARDASKVALVHLCARLWHAGFTVLDTQFINDHLLQFGAYEISRADYRQRLASALMIRADFSAAEISEPALIRAYLAMRGTKIVM